MTRSDHYDAIVVCGGHNGLVAAHYLASAGLKRAVFERRSTLGGPCGTVEFFPRYRGSITNSPGSFEPAIYKDLELERFTNLPEIIEQVRCFSPLDLEREYGLLEANITYGDIVPSQMFGARPIHGWSAYETSVRISLFAGRAPRLADSRPGMPGRRHRKTQRRFCSHYEEFGPMTVEPLQIRRIITHVEDRFIEGGRALSRPIRIAAAVAVIKNPWHGQGFVEDLKPQIKAVAAELGQLLSERVIEAAGGAEAVQSFGKASVVGMGGELEHASGLVHTLRFGNQYRDRLQAQKLLRSTDKRAPTGAGIDLSLVHHSLDDARDYPQSLQICIPDAPADDEILVILTAASGPRPHARIGTRTEEIAEMRARGELK